MRSAPKLPKGLSGKFVTESAMEARKTRHESCTNWLLPGRLARESASEILSLGSSQLARPYARQDPHRRSWGRT
jgi:hypothetical protein